MKVQTICLYYRNGQTETITTKNPEKAKRVYGATSYIPLDQDFTKLANHVNENHLKLMEQ